MPNSSDHVTYSNASVAETVALGDDLIVNRIGYGAMRLCGPRAWGEPADSDGAMAVLRRAVELGVNLIDTADFYGPAVANRLIADALGPYPQDLILSTKVGVKRSEDQIWQPSERPDEVRSAVEDNIAHLGVERIDIVHLRLGDGRVLAPSDVPLAESLGALRDL